MDVKRLQQLLESVQSGDTSVEDALESLKRLPYEDLGYATLDSHRSLRTGFPEVIFCASKTAAQIAGIVERMRTYSDTILATRVTPEAFEAMRLCAPEAVYHEAARIALIARQTPVPKDPSRYILVVSAGTSDIAVAEEAAVTAEAMGSRVERLYDVGVAGIHRLLGRTALLQNANALVVVAGMEGALASVVGGLVSRPVVAVPTSVGYGASFQGLAALLTMLNSCASGVAVVNIDNGFGAGFFAHLVNER
ncbi:MAG: nickel pincer cofactor biosynthesis protein LarB [Armatimonadetes bacterium]|nr:nickel pincer cofactor biosynthesis protein LarB [Armatimonadota bacterium]